MSLGTGELVEVHDQSMGSNDDPSTSEMLPESKLFEVTEAELAHLQADEELFHAKLLRHSKRKIMGGNVIGNGGGGISPQEQNRPVLMTPIQAILALESKT